MYCEKCQVLFEEGNVCPICEKSRNVREPQEDDLCFLTEEENMWADMIEDVLKQNDVSFTWRQAREGWLGPIFGQKFDRHRFYVSYCDYEKAKGLLDSLEKAQPAEEE